jgi:multiple sugar transport system permease protein
MFSRSALLVAIIALALIWITPLVATFFESLKSNDDYTSNPIWTLPSRIALPDNINFAWTTGTLGTSFLNTILYASVGAVVAIILASLAAYALVRLKVRGRFGWFLLIYSGTIFPFQMYLLPLYYLYINTNLYDTRFGLNVFYIAICIPFCLFVLRNYFTTISEEITEAARLDGLSDFGVYIYIFMPISFSALAALFLFQFTWIWNELLFGITLARSQDVRPVMAGLAGLQGIYAAVNIPGVLAGALIASVPTVIIFLILRRYLLQGLVLSTQGE